MSKTFGDTDGLIVRIPATIYVQVRGCSRTVIRERLAEFIERSALDDPGWDKFIPQDTDQGLTRHVRQPIVYIDEQALEKFEVI